MASLDRSAVSALINQIGDLARQLAAEADRVRGGHDDDVAGQLFEAERSLHMAGRALERVLRTGDR